MTRHSISLKELGGFEVDDADGRLYWKGQGVVLEQRISLRPFELGLATIASLATLTAAVWPILLHFKVLA